MGAPADVQARVATVAWAAAAVEVSSCSFRVDCSTRLPSRQRARRAKSDIAALLDSLALPLLLLVKAPTLAHGRAIRRQVSWAAPAESEAMVGMEEPVARAGPAHRAAAAAFRSWRLLTILMENRS